SAVGGGYRAPPRSLPPLYQMRGLLLLPFSFSQITCFLLLSAVCVMLNLAGSILSCQNAHLIASLQRCMLYKFDRAGVCVCCEIQERATECTHLGETLKLNPVLECGAVRVLLKDLLFSICTLNVISTMVCALATATCCTQIVTADIIHMFIPQRLRAGTPECWIPNDVGVPQVMDYDEFIPPIPPPPYYPPEYTRSPALDTQRLLHLHFPCRASPCDVTVASHGDQYPSELPPPYEAVVSESSTAQVIESGHHSIFFFLSVSGVVSPAASGAEGVQGHTSPADLYWLEVQVLLGAGEMSLYNTIYGSHSDSCPSPATAHRRSRPLASPSLLNSNQHCQLLSRALPTSASTSGSRNSPSRRQRDRMVRSTSDPVTCCSLTDGKYSTLKYKIFTSHLDKERPHSLVDLKTYKDTKILVAKFLEHSKCSLPPEVRHVVNNIRTVIKSDEVHMEEAIFSARVLEEVSVHLSASQPAPALPRPSSTTTCIYTAPLVWRRVPARFLTVCGIGREE
uniref:Family with sequence similarity 189 member A1 n=1 Tax=Callorhinchus milii TaxID=7868 RepID=A0A4W3IVV9_CALMI